MNFRRFLGRRATAPDDPEAPLPPPPAFWQFRSSTVFIVTVVCIATFTDIFLYGLIVPVMPFALTVRAGVHEDKILYWNSILLACYGIALFVGSPIAGYYADRTSSRRIPLLAGLVALAGATILLCVGRSVGVFVAGRILQGLSAAVVWSVGLALLADTMGNRIGMAMGYTSIAMSMGLLLSPVIGGYVYEGAGYYSVYYVSFGLIFLDIVLRLMLLEKCEVRKWVKAQDNATTATDTDLEHNADPASDGGATAATNAEALPQMSSVRRVWILLSDPRLLSALFGCVIVSAVVTSFDAIVPLFVKELFNWTSAGAGLIFFAPYFPPVVVSPPVGFLADRYGSKYLVLFGFAATVPLLVCMRFVDENTVKDKVLLAALLALAGSTITISNVPIMAEISFAISARARMRPGLLPTENSANGLGYGMFTMSFALGSALGSLAAGNIQSEYGWGTVTWALAVFCVVGSIPVLLWTGEFALKPGKAAGAVAVPETETIMKDGGEYDEGKQRGANEKQNGSLEIQPDSNNNIIRPETGAEKEIQPSEDNRPRPAASENRSSSA